MACGGSSVNDEPDYPSFYDESRRRDLGDAFAIILTLPFHAEDDQGRWRYGLRPLYGWANPELIDEFKEEMRSLIVAHAGGLVAKGVVDQKTLHRVEPRPYETGPAAQAWPCFLYNPYQDARPFLNDGASLLAWGMFFRTVLDRLKGWERDKQERLPDPESESQPAPAQWAPVLVDRAFTRPVIIALCYADLVERYGIGEDVAIETFPRAWPEFYSPDHPCGAESYLVRATVGRRSFFYEVAGSGDVTQHFLLTGSDLTLLPLPSFVGGEPSYGARPVPSQRVMVKAN